jgi:hypothetical protein
VLHQQESRRKLVRAASPATATTSTSADRQRQRPPLHQQRQRPLLRAAYQRWRSPQGVRHRKEVLAPVLMRGATTRPLKPKSRGLGGRGALMVPLAEATTSAVGSLTSSGNHLSTNDSDHLCTGRQRLPQHARRGPRSRPLTGVTTRPSKNAAATPAAYDVLYDPPPPSAANGQETPWMWRTRARRDCHPCGGRTSTPRPERQEAASEAAPKPSSPKGQTRCS